jgi:hypothetical protein
LPTATVTSDYTSWTEWKRVSPKLAHLQQRCMAVFSGQFLGIKPHWRNHSLYIMLSKLLESICLCVCVCVCVCICVCIIAFGIIKCDCVMYRVVSYNNFFLVILEVSCPPHLCSCGLVSVVCSIRFTKSFKLEDTRTHCNF